MRSADPRTFRSADSPQFRQKIRVPDVSCHRFRSTIYYTKQEQEALRVLASKQSRIT